MLWVRQLTTTTACLLCVAGVARFDQARAANPEPWYSPQVGQAHPDLTLRRVDNGEQVSLSDYRGKKVILIHFASW